MGADEQPPSPLGFGMEHKYETCPPHRMDLEILFG